MSTRATAQAKQQQEENHVVRGERPQGAHEGEGVGVDMTLLQRAVGNREASRVLQGLTRYSLSAIDVGQPNKFDAGFGAKHQPSVAFPPACVHTGPEADDRTRAEGAAAYTKGRNVYLRSGIDPTSNLGARVVTHELMHVAQQERGRAGWPLSTEADLEHEASAVSGVGTVESTTFEMGAAAPNSVQKLTEKEVKAIQEEELHKEWRQLHPRKGLATKPVAPGNIPEVDEEAEQAEREAYAAWREDRLKQLSAKVRPGTEADEARKRAGAAEEAGALGFTDAEGRPVQGPVTLLPSEVFMPVVQQSKATPKQLLPKRNLAAEAKAGWEARTSPREKAEAAKRPPPGMFIGEHERALLKASKMFDIVPGAKLGRNIVEFIEGEDILGRKLSRREVSREISKETLFQVVPLLIPEVGMIGEGVGSEAPLIERELGEVAPTVEREVGGFGGLGRETVADLPPTEPIGDVFEPSITPPAEHPEGFLEHGVEAPEVAPEPPLESTAHPPAGDVEVRGIYGKQLGRASPGQHTVPEGVGSEGGSSATELTVEPSEGGPIELEQNQYPRARTPRSKNITTAEQIEGIPEKTVAESAREDFNRVRDAYAEALHVPPNGDVHHAIELDVLDQFPGVFEPGELNTFENMRGIRPEFNDQLHLSKLRTEWNRHNKNLEQILSEEGLVEHTPEYNARVRQYIFDARDEIDYLLGQFFTETRAPYGL